MLASTLRHHPSKHQQNVHPFSRTCTIDAKVHSSWSGGLWQTITLLRRFFFFNLSLICTNPKHYLSEYIKFILNHITLSIYYYCHFIQRQKKNWADFDTPCRHNTARSALTVWFIPFRTSLHAHNVLALTLCYIIEPLMLVWHDATLSTTEICMRQL